MKSKILIFLSCLSLMFTLGCKKSTSLITANSSSAPTSKLEVNAVSAFIHPGMLHSQADFIRMQTMVSAGADPWLSGWNKLTANTHSASTYSMQGPVDTVYRGSGSPQNYSKLYNDIAAAYQNALRWKINGDVACGNKAVTIMNAWSSTLTAIGGSADRWLAAGIYGYEFANAAEIMRDYSGWSATDFTRFKNMMLNVFYPMNHDFLINHNGACITNYWANWDLCSMASILSIGILCDDTNKFNEAITYFKTGAGNGSIDHAVPFLYNSGQLGQGQESGRDQGHQCLDISLLGAFCQMAYNQGQDLFAYENNKALAVSEYTASYNLGNTVPFTTYNYANGQNCTPQTQTVIAEGGRGDIRPSWELIYNYQKSHGITGTTYSGQYATNVRPEGGGGDYGPNSGGYDQLGFGTLTHSVGAQPITNGTYKLINRASGKYLDNLGATTNGANVGQWASSGSNNQKWVLTYSGGYYKLACVTGSKCLDSYDHTADGSTVAQWASGSSTNQQWTIIPVGSYYKIVNRTNGKCLDSGGGATDGAIMQFWPSGSSNNQQWTIAP
ncbi:RICIN domain-containing protein [Mucilaginibacter lappiensis]|uniref:RICIN domain-containing protein n=1 Tax=Mucilaginibacter lappiensis TaxID=354630 RepID=UPI003D262230